jgi:hypothetical protein
MTSQGGSTKTAGKEKELNHDSKKTAREVVVTRGKDGLGMALSEAEAGGVKGAMVAMVAPGSPAEVAGVRLHDVVQSVNGVSLVDKTLSQVCSLSPSLSPRSPVHLSLSLSHTCTRTHPCRPLLASHTSAGAGNHSQDV